MSANNGGYAVFQALLGFKNMWWFRTETRSDFGFYFKIAGSAVNAQSLNNVQQWIGEWAAASGLTIQNYQETNG
ncbi:hypothetical protein BKA67DRAFT_647470, partial [Truncatella angustata]